MAKYKLSLTLSNGKTVDASGYIEIPDSPSVNIVQVTGTSEESVMSQKATTDSIDAIKGVSGTVTLTASAWNNNSYTLNVSSLGANDAIFFSPTNATGKAALENANIVISVNGTTVTFTANSAPSVDISLNYFIVRGKA